MERQPILGVLSIIASLPPLWLASGFVLGFGVSFGSWIFLSYAIPGAAALVAGLLLSLGQRQSYFWGVLGWSLLVLAAALGLLISWWSYAPGSMFSTGILITEGLYVAAGFAVLIHLFRRRHRTKGTANGGTVAA